MVEGNGEARRKVYLVTVADRAGLTKDQAAAFLRAILDEIRQVGRVVHLDSFGEFSASVLQGKTIRCGISPGGPAKGTILPSATIPQQVILRFSRLRPATWYVNGRRPTWEATPPAVPGTGHPDAVNLAAIAATALLTREQGARFLRAILDELRLGREVYLDNFGSFGLSVAADRVTAADAAIDGVARTCGERWTIRFHRSKAVRPYLNGKVETWAP